jgi:iron-sulfur cluster assembly accessory protein
MNKKMEKPAVTKDMTIGEVVAKYPESAEVMLAYGLHCIGCHVNPYESIEAGAYGHGMSPETIEKMVNEINEAINPQNSEKEIIISTPAADKFKELMEKENKKGWGLKLIVESQGCNGMSYSMDFAEKPEDSETTLSDNGLNVFVQKSQLNLVKGIRIDYSKSPTSEGFKIKNPNKGICGCGGH